MLYCLLSGLLIAFSFPTIIFGWHLPNLGFLAWFGLVPLFLAIRAATPRRAFFYGSITAFVYYFISFYWLYIALHDFGNLSPVVSVLTLVMFSIAPACYIGFACFLSRWFIKKTKTEGILWFPIFFTLIEWLRNYTPFGGLPWSNLSMGQSNYLYLIQIADIIGVYGIIFLLVWLNAWLVELILKFQGMRVPYFRQKNIVTLLLVVLVLGYGFYQLRNQKHHDLETPHLKVGLIQPNIPQNEKWVRAFMPEQMRIFEESVQSLQESVDLIVWPETSWFQTPWISTRKIAPEKFFVTHQDGNRPYTLLGLSFVTRKDNKESYFNSAALLDSRGNILGKYQKVHLVPFGEYVPFKKLLSFLSPVAAIGDFAAGDEAHPLTLDRFKFAPLICYEDIFPGLSRKMVKEGANFLLNITNDAWYGFTSAAYQHLALAQFRAVETRRAMIRTTNTGVTAIIDPTGKIANIAPMFERSLLVHQIPMLFEMTIYTKLGDWFIAACFLFVLWQGVQLFRRAK